MKTNIVEQKNKKKKTHSKKYTVQAIYTPRSASKSWKKPRKHS